MLQFHGFSFGAVRVYSLKVLHLREMKAILLLSGMIDEGFQNESLSLLLFCKERTTTSRDASKGPHFSLYEGRT